MVSRSVFVEENEEQKVIGAHWYFLQNSLTNACVLFHKLVVVHLAILPR